MKFTLSNMGIIGVVVAVIYWVGLAKILGFGAHSFVVIDFLDSNIPHIKLFLGLFILVAYTPLALIVLLLDIIGIDIYDICSWTIGPCPPTGCMMVLLGDSITLFFCVAFVLGVTVLYKKKLHKYHHIVINGMSTHGTSRNFYSALLTTTQMTTWHE